jgi:hypothetical protein
VIQKEKVRVKTEQEGSCIPATCRPYLKVDEAAKMGIWRLLRLVLIKPLLFILALGMPADLPIIFHFSEYHATMGGIYKSKGEN